MARNHRNLLLAADPQRRSLSSCLHFIKIVLVKNLSEIGRMVLLHAFIKKTQKTPKQELELAFDRKSQLEAINNEK
jgi:phage-related protein